MFENGGDEINEDKRIEIFEKVCGSQAVYVCPFCNKISDADIQAAMWIALKGHLNMFVYDGADKELKKYWGTKAKSEKCFNEEKWSDGTIKEKIGHLLEFAEKKGISPIKFSFSARPDIYREINKEKQRKNANTKE